MTFKEFRATCQYCDDLGAALGDATLAGVHGYLYCDVLFIENTATWCRPDQGDPWGPNWYAMIGRSEYRSNNLTEIERRLYDFAVAHGYTA